MLGIYASNEDKVMFYKQLMERLMDFSNETWFLKREWNGNGQNFEKNIKY